jgi:hypothetical protein
MTFSTLGPNPDPAPLSLTPKQIIILTLFGVLLWFLAAVLVRTIGPMGGLSGTARWITYALVIPGTIPAILIARRLASLFRQQTAVGITIVTATALLLDGIAHAWFPSLYGSDPALILAGAGAIFWGAGVALVLGLVMSRDQGIGA